MDELSVFGGAGFGDVLLGAVVIDGQEAYFDDGALHGRSRVEAGIEFWSDRTQLSDGSAQRIFFVWVAVKEQGPQRYGYIGLADTEIWVDRDRGIGYKNLTEQANRMSEAVGGRVRLDRLTADERTLLAQCLRERAMLWRHAGPAVTAALPSGASP